MAIWIVSPSADAGRRQLAGAHLVPDLEVGAGVGDDGGLAGGAAGGVDARQLGAGHGQQAEGIVVAEVALAGEGQQAQVVEGAHVLGPDAAGAERLPVEGHGLVGPLELPLQQL